MIYQLAKTSTLLSGQVKWDLVMNGNSVSNLQFVPISEHIPFNYDNPVDVMNYSHCDNIKSHYAKISGNFYTPVVDPNLSTEHLHRSVDVYQDTHEGTYEMGMKRMEYHRYSKQFSFFCPFWCDNINEFNKLRFKICVKNAKKDRVLYSSFINIDYIKDYMSKYFDALGVYALEDDKATLFYNDVYYKRIGEDAIYPGLIVYRDVMQSSNESGYQATLNDRLVDESTNLIWKPKTVNPSNPAFNTYSNEGVAKSITKFMSENTDLLYLDFSEYRAWVKGINAKAGVVQTCDCSQVINDITSQERPMLEFDNMLANTFAKNYLICTQLFNFNFVFNIDDFLPNEFTKDMLGEKLNVYVDMYCGNDKVEVRDFYSNYEFIPRYDTVKTTYTDKNAFDYLKDNHDIDIINKNKLVQSTFHWALQTNPSILFNMYDGMSALQNGQEQSHGVMDTFSNLYAEKFDLADNPKGIFGYHYLPEITVSNISEKMYSYLSYTDDTNFVTLDLTDFSKEYKWFGNLLINNYKLKDLVENSVLKDYEELRMIYIKVNVEKSSGISKGFIDKILVEGKYFERLSGPTDTNFAMFVNYGGTEIEPVKKITYLFFEFNGDEQSWLKNHMYFNGILNVNGLELLTNILNNCVIKPDIYKFDKSIASEHYNSPEITSEEIDYTKFDKHVAIQRHDLLIYPYFVAIDNAHYKNYVYWCKQYINTLDNEDNLPEINSFNSTSFSKFAPNYPSIDYCVLKKQEIDYNNFYLKEPVEGLLFEGDMSWYKDNSLFLLPNTVYIEYTGKELTTEKVNTLLYDYMHNNIDVETKTDVEKAMYDLFEQKIYKLYKSTFTFDYANERTTDTYIYKIKYELR